jgi:hypothetical protein
MSRPWDLDDIVTVTDIAAELGYKRAAVGNWATRHPDFPEPLTTVACGHTAVYSLRQVRAWYDARDWQTDGRTGKHTGGARTRRLTQLA